MSAAGWISLDGRARKVLLEHDGIAHVSAFDAADITRRQLGALRGRGVLERPRTGWYVDPELPWQVKIAVRVGGVTTCVTSAELWGLPVPPESYRHVHVLVDEHDSRLRHSRNSRWVLATVDDDPRVELHWSRRHDRTTVGRTSLVDTLLLLIECVPETWFIAALDAALHRPRDGRPILDATEYGRFAELIPRRLRHLIDQTDPSAESCLETLLRLAMVRRGIGPIVLQAQPHPAHRVDFLVRGRLIVEADGDAFHDPERDRIRDAELTALGYRVLRFDYRRITFDIESVLDDIEAALAELEA